MSNKLHNSVIALTLLLGLAGTPKVVSLELKDSLHVAQASEEIVPETTEERGGTSWYWLLLLLIPIGLGGLLLARRTQSQSEVGATRDNRYTTTNANTPTTRNDSSLASLDSEPTTTTINRTANTTATANRIEDETVLTTGLTSYDLVGDRQSNDSTTKRNLADNATPVIDRQPDIPYYPQERSLTESTEPAIAKDAASETDATISETNLQDDTLENTDRELRDLYSDIDDPASSEAEISLEEITFEESAEADLTSSSTEEEDIFEWLGTLDDGKNEDDLDEISEWLNSLDTEPATESQEFTTTTTDPAPTHDLSLYEEISTSDDDTFQELHDLLNEERDRQ